MKELSQAVVNSKKSSIRKLFELLLKSGPDAISFGIGQPDFTAPEFVNDQIIQALRDNKTLYAPAVGIHELREVVARKFREENQILWATAENVIITNGGSQALTLAYAILTNPGDEFIVSSPNFISYYYLANYFGLKCVEVPRKPDFAPDIEGIRNAITDKTKFILINSPNNPTGYVLSKEEMDQIVEIVKKHDLYLVSDEVYEKFLYGDRPHISPASYEGMAERTITMNAMSKTFGATGLRCGYIAASPVIIANMEKYIQYTTAGVNHPVQYGAISGLINVEKMHIHEIIRRYNEKRKICVNRLQAMGFTTVEPMGAFYIMPRLNPKWNISGDEFSSLFVKEKLVACTPGDAFGSHSDDCLRISYATSDEKLNTGFDRMEAFMKEHGFTP